MTKHRIPWQRKIAFSYSDPGDTLENKLNNLKHFYSRNKSFAFEKKLKKMLLHFQVNLANQNKQQPKEDACHVPYMTSQYETNLWSTHVNIVRLAEPIRHCVRWRTQVFKIKGFVCKRFLPSPPPLSFFGSRFISRVVKTENPVPRFFLAPKLNGNACYAGYKQYMKTNLPSQFSEKFCLLFFTWKKQKELKCINHTFPCINNT